MAPAPEKKDKTIKLPKTASRTEKYTYLKLIERVSSKPMAMCFEGRILEPGAHIKESELRGSKLLLELAGMVGKGRERESLYVVWRFNGTEFVEVGRASSPDASWVNVIRPMVLAEMERRLVDLGKESERICSDVLQVLDRELESTVPGVKIVCLSRLYEEVEARMAGAAG